MSNCIFCGSSDAAEQVKFPDTFTAYQMLQAGSHACKRCHTMFTTGIYRRKCFIIKNGDVKEVLRLIQYLPGLGKKVAYGYGSIKSVSVEELKEDYSLVKDGVAMRPLPCKLGFCSDVVMRLAWRSPYWDKRNIIKCVPPGEKVYVN